MAEWAARIVISYLVCPADGVDLTDEAEVRRLVRLFVLPGIRALGELRHGDGSGHAARRTARVTYFQPNHGQHQRGSIMTEQMRETADIIGRDEINDLEAIISVVNTDVDEERHGVAFGLRHHLHLGLREGSAPQARQAVREGQEGPVERPDRPPVGDRGRPGAAGRRQRRRQRRPRRGSRRERDVAGTLGRQGVDPVRRGEPELDAVAVHARRAGCARVHGQDRGVGAVDRRQVLRGHPGDGRSPARRGLRQVPRRQAVGSLPDQRPPADCCSTTSSPTAAGT